MSRTTDMAQRVDTERALVIFFLVIGGSMFALTFTFDSSSAALFPRITAAVIVIGAVLLLFQNALPERARQLVAEPVSIGTPDDKYESTAGGKDESPLPTTRQVPDTVATFSLLLGYIGLSFLIGILWATPVFSLLYSWWFDQSRLVTGIVFVTSFVIVFAFYFLVNAPLEDGLLLELIW